MMMVSMTKRSLNHAKTTGRQGRSYICGFLLFLACIQLFQCLYYSDQGSAYHGIFMKLQNDIGRILLDHNNNVAAPSTNSDRLGYEIFYHVYIKPEDPGYSKGIVQEQLAQIGDSFANVNALDHDTPLVVNINVVGFYDKDTENMILDICKAYSMDCSNIASYETGFEALTLSQVRNYCEDNVQDKVIYLHSKGTFHYEPHQAPWRRSLTNAATQEDCLYPPDDTCNLCGVSFQPFWTTFIPGNMWTAQCKYISKLVPIHEFSEAMEQVVQYASEDLHLGSNLYENARGDIHGVGRYADEHWVGSHPDLVPCDVSKVTTMPRRAWSRTGNDRDEREPPYEWAMAPRKDINKNAWTGSNRNYAEVINSEELRFTEYTFLPGLILKWQKLYNKVPADNSWAWKFYPDGEEWRAATAVHGDQVVPLAMKSLSDVSKFKRDGLEKKKVIDIVEKIAMGLIQVEGLAGNEEDDEDDYGDEEPTAVVE